MKSDAYRRIFNKLIFSTRTTLSLVILFIFLIGTFVPNVSFSQSASNNNNTYHPVVPPQHHNSIKCNCVVFRMDDLQDYWHDAAQIAAMNLFISKNQSLTEGIIMRAIGNDSRVVDKVAEGHRKGLFELALHGLDHVDYTKLSEQQQKESLRVANGIMHRVFGYPSNIFITPYGPFNTDTIQAMKQDGLSILSASTPDEEHFDHSGSIFSSGQNLLHPSAVSSTANTSLVYHLPGMTFFGIDENGIWIPATFPKILSDVDNNIAKYGYAVIVFHPQDLVQYDQKTGKATNLLNASRIKDLSSLVDLVVSKKIPISSFSKITGIEDQSYRHILAPLIKINMKTNSTKGVNSNGSSTAKTIILTFDDNWKSQFTNATPVLDKYGLKASFFVVCNYVGRDNNTRMNWQDVLSLQNDGMDIESHTMNHKNLDKLSAAKLDYEVGQSKQCLHSHGITGPTIMATPFDEGWNNATVIQSIAKYYDLARSGNSDITFLHCDKWNSAQTDCRTYSNNGTLTYGNRFSIMAWNHNFYDNTYMHNQSGIFDKFVQVVNKQTLHNMGGTVDAIPIIEYHNVANDNSSYSTSVNLFNAEMKYLHDNGFKAKTMSDIRYNDTSNFLYFKNS